VKSLTLYAGLIICSITGILYPQWVLEGRFDGEIIPAIERPLQFMVVLPQHYITY